MDEVVDRLTWDDGATQVDLVRETSIFADDEATGEAVILGSLSGELTLLEYGAAGPEGHAPQILYVDTETARALGPTAIPQRPSLATASAAEPMTPYERFVLESIDGARTMTDLAQGGLLSRDEIAGVLLSLVERGLVEMSVSRRPEAPAKPPEPKAKEVEIVVETDRGAPAAAPEDDDDATRERASPAFLAPQAPVGALAPTPRGPGDTRARLGDPGDESETGLVRDWPPRPSAPPAPAPPPRLPAPMAPPPVAAPEVPPARALVAPARTPEPMLTPIPPRPPPTSPAATNLILARESSSIQKPAIAARATPNASPLGAHPEESAALNLRARALFEAAIADRDRLDLIGARMNVKLAIALDPSNTQYQQLFFALADHAAGKNLPKLKSAEAQQAFEEGCQAEVRADVESAIRCFERALQHSEEAIVLNRLAVLLATRKKAFVRARALLTRAIELAPASAIYRRNLDKIVTSHQALSEQQKAVELKSREPTPPPVDPFAAPAPKAKPRSKSFLATLFGFGRKD